MNDLRERLARCFVAVFPTLTPDAARAASSQTLPSWDSLATVTLVNVIEEEFGVQIEPEDFGALVSFDAAEVLVQKAGERAP